MDTTKKIYTVRTFFPYDDILTIILEKDKKIMFAE